MADLQIRLLGEPEVLWSGRQVKIERRLTRHLLYYLSSQPGLVNRNRLINLFWGDKDEHSARSNLRQSLHRLRSSFTGVPLLHEQGELVGVNFDAVEVDALKFINDFDIIYHMASRYSPSKPLETDILQKLMALNNLWHGTSFLGETDIKDSPGLDEWYYDLRDRLHYRRKWVLERLADHALAGGDEQEAVRFIDMGLVNNEMDEGLNKRMLDALLIMRRFDEAQTYYKKLSRKLTADGLELSTEFRSQFGYLANPVTRPRSSTKLNWNADDKIEMPFVGRRSELDILTRQYLAGGTVFMFGESGLGKSRLLATFIDQAQPAPRVLLARARPGETNLPYQPLVDSLRQGIQAREWLQLSSVYISHLSQLIPELMVNRTNIKLPPLLSHEQARALLQEALRQLFLLIAEKQRLILVLDDAQWVDEATSSALEYLITRPPFDRRALIIIAARIEELNPAIMQMHNHMIREHAVKTIELDQLQWDEITRLIQGSLRIPVPAALVEQVARDSGGNPLYIGEIITSMANVNITELESGQLPTSETLTMLIKARLGMLPQATQRVLEAAAVLGYDFSLVDLSGITQYSPEQLSTALQELEKRHLLRINSAQNEFNKVQINFIHDKFREVQLQMISPALLPSLHRQAAITLKASAGDKLDDWASIIAQHYEQAGEFVEAFHLWIRASDHSLDLYSTNEADYAFQRAAAVIPQCGKNLEDEAIYLLFEAWGELRSNRNNTSGVAEIGDLLIKIGHLRHSDLLVCSGHHWLCVAAFTANDFQNGLKEANIALRYLPELNFPKANIRVYWDLGVLQLMTGQIQAGEASLTKALEYFNYIDTENPIAMVWMAGIYYELGMIKTLSGWPKLGNEYGHRALDVLHKIQKVNQFVVNQNITLVSSLIGMTEHYMGRYTDADQRLKKALEPAIQGGESRVVGYLHDYLSINELAMGNLDEMYVHVEQAIQIGEYFQRKEIHSFVRQALGDAFIRLQDFPSARECFAQALSQNQDTFLTPYFMIHLGFCDITLGNIENGFKLISEAENICQKYGLGFIEADANIGYFSYYSNTGNWEACKSRAEQCISFCEERSLDYIKVFAEYFLGLSLIQTGDHSRGLELLNRVANTAQSTKNFQAEILTRQSIALIMNKAGLDAPANLERLKEMLERYNAHTQSAIWRGRFQKLLENLVKEEGIPGLFSSF